MTDLPPEKNPETYSIGDLIRALHTNPLDAIARADEPAIEEQVADPSAEDMAEIEDLAVQAAELQDEIKSLVGDRNQRLRSLKNQLKDKLLKHGLNEVNISGRPPIELTESKNRKPTRKAIIKAMQDQLGEKEGKMKALNLWYAIEPTTSYSVNIPDRTPGELDSPY